MLLGQRAFMTHSPFILPSLSHFGKVIKREGQMRACLGVGEGLMEVLTVGCTHPCALETVLGTTNQYGRLPLETTDHTCHSFIHLFIPYQVFNLYAIWVKK